MANKLTLKQETFISAYLGAAHGNATEAARIAGYCHPRQAGSEVLANPVIASRVSAVVTAAAMSAEDVLAELASIARADWKDFIQVKVNGRGDTVESKIVLGDKVRALELLGKYHKLFTDKTEITGKDGGVIRVAQALAEMTDAELEERARALLTSGSDTGDDKTGA